MRRAWPFAWSATGPDHDASIVRSHSASHRSKCSAVNGSRACTRRWASSTNPA